jgi:hypothetical protein
MEEACTCSECGTELTVEYRYCPRCGVALAGQDEVVPVVLTLRYSALRMVVEGFRVLAVTVALAGLAGVVYVLVYRATVSNAQLLIALSIGGGTLGTVTLFAAAESIKVFMDIEENTRRSVELLSRMRF